MELSLEQLDRFRYCPYLWDVEPDSFDRPEILTAKGVKNYFWNCLKQKDASNSFKRELFGNDKTKEIASKVYQHVLPQIKSIVAVDVPIELIFTDFFLNRNVKVPLHRSHTIKGTIDAICYLHNSVGAIAFKILPFHIPAQLLKYDLSLNTYKYFLKERLDMDISVGVIYISRNYLEIIPVGGKRIEEFLRNIAMMIEYDLGFPPHHDRCCGCPQNETCNRGFEGENT